MTEKKFSKLTFDERLSFTAEHLGLSVDELKHQLNSAYESHDLADKLIEASVGYYGMPLGLVEKITLNDKDYVVPMAIEETSVIAAMNNAAKWVRTQGVIKAETLNKGQGFIGQIHLKGAQDIARLEKALETYEKRLIDLANAAPASGMASRGGGVKALKVHGYDHVEGYRAAAVHVFVDVCDAMGANVINQVCEFLKPHLEQILSADVQMCILSNYNDHQPVRVVCTINDVDAKLGEAIEAASMIAESDSHRAATHNKGIMNGIDAVLIATGNDFRAVEAGLHAYAARSGKYRALSKWRYENGTLTGTFEGPINVGVVGGVTHVHPAAAAALQILKVQSADELSHIVAASGLLQNLAALKALSTVGIVKGHMRLHLKNILMTVDATENENVQLERELTQILLEKKYISRSNALDVLEKIRA